MVGLGHPVPAAVARDESQVCDRIAGLEPCGKRRAEVPVDVAEVAPLGVGSIALGADPSVPVMGGRRGGVRRDPAAEGIDPRGLVEVAVNDESAAAHPPVVAAVAAVASVACACVPVTAATSSAPRSPVVVTVWVTTTSWEAPGASTSGQDSSSPAPW